MIDEHILHAVKVTERGPIVKEFGGIPPLVFQGKKGCNSGWIRRSLNYGNIAEAGWIAMNTVTGSTGEMQPDKKKPPA